MPSRKLGESGHCSIIYVSRSSIYYILVYIQYVPAISLNYSKSSTKVYCPNFTSWEQRLHSRKSRERFRKNVFSRLMVELSHCGEEIKHTWMINREVYTSSFKSLLVRSFTESRNPSEYQRPTEHHRTKYS